MSQTNSYWDKVLNRRIGRRRAIAATGALTASAAFLAACGGDDDDDDDSGGGSGGGSGASPTATTASGSSGGGSSGSTDTGAPKSGGTLTFPMRTEPVHLDLAFVSLYAINTVWGQVYNGLLKMTSGSDVAPNEAAVVSDLPGEWEQPDELTFTFKLSDQTINFQDVDPVNGREMTAEDIKYTFDRRLDPQIPQITTPVQIASVDSVEAIDAKTIQFKLNQPDAVLQSYLADPSWSIIPREIVEADGDMRQRAVGTGPFIMSDWNKGVSVTLTKNPNYWDEGKPYLDEIRALVVGDYSTQQGQFIAGQLDLISQIEDPIQSEEIESQVSEAIKEEWVTKGLSYGLKISGRNSPGLGDIRTRQAIGAAYNRALAIDTVYGGSAISSTPFPPAFAQGQPDWQVPSEELGPTYNYDPEVARGLLEAAGTLGLSVEIAVSGAGHGPQSSGNGAFLTENLNAAGFDAHVYDAPYPEFASKFGYNADGNYDIMRAAHATTWDVADAYLGQVNYAVTGTGNNDRNFDPKLLEMSLTYRTLLNDEDRKAAGFEIQKYHAEQANYILTEANIYRDFWRPFVKNYRPASLWAVGWGARVFREVWLDK